MALKNPALTTLIASNPKAVEKAGKTALVFSVVTIAVLGGALYYHFVYKHRFEKVSLDKKAPAPRISKSLAKVKADALYKAMHGVGANYSQVKAVLSGIQKNDFILIYNAFGKRKPMDSLSLTAKDDMDLSAWLQDQFNASELAELRFLTGANDFF